MKKGAVAALIVLLAGAGGAAGWYYYNNNSFLPVSDKKDVVYVTLVSTVMGRISGAENRFAGVVEPQDTVAVQKDPDRKVREVMVKVGDTVTKGQLLFEYDLSSIENKLAEARLDLERLQNEALSYSNQINTYQTERQKKENANRQLDLLIDIQTAELNLKKNEYDQRSKEAEIIRLESATGNTQVLSEIDGIIQKIDTTKLSTSDDAASVSDSLEQPSSYTSGSDSSGDAFITILSTGEYRVKGIVNELNRDEIIPGEGAVIRSRADETKVWHGTMGSVDSQNNKSSGSSDPFSSGNDYMTSSSSYPFYVELDESEGLMLGQHVYIEKDVGQQEQRSGIWLPEDFIVDAETDNPYVWMADENNKLVRKTIKLGEHELYELKYEVLDGITEYDYIAFPSSSLEEGMPVRPGTLDQTVVYEEMDEEEYYDEEYEEMDDQMYVEEDGEGFGKFDSDSGEIYDDTENWEMDESLGEDPYVIEGEDVYVVEDSEAEGWEDFEVIEEYPGDEGDAAWNDGSGDVTVIEEFPEETS